MFFVRMMAVALILLQPLCLSGMVKPYFPQLQPDVSNKIAPEVLQKIDVIRVNGTQEQKKRAAYTLDGSCSPQEFLAFMAEQERGQEAAREAKRKKEYYEQRTWEGREYIRQKKARALVASIGTRVRNDPKYQVDDVIIVPHQEDFSPAGLVQGFIGHFDELLQQRHALAQEYASWSGLLQHVHTFYSPFVCTYRYEETGEYKRENTRNLLDDNWFTNSIMPFLHQAEPEECETILKALDTYKVKYLPAAAEKYNNIDGNYGRTEQRPKVHAFEALIKRGLVIDEEAMLSRIVDYGLLPFMKSILKSSNILKTDQQFTHFLFKNAAHITCCALLAIKRHDHNSYFWCNNVDNCFSIVELLGEQIQDKGAIQEFIHSFEGEFLRKSKANAHDYEGLLTPEELGKEQNSPYALATREVLAFLKKTFPPSVEEMV